MKHLLTVLGTCLLLAACSPMPTSSANLEELSAGATTPTSASSGSSWNRTSVRCSAYTKKGTRCKRTTTSPNGRCYQHGG